MDSFGEKCLLHDMTAPIETGNFHNEPVPSLLPQNPGAVFLIAAR